MHGVALVNQHLVNPAADLGAHANVSRLDGSGTLQRVFFVQPVAENSRGGQDGDRPPKSK